MTDLTMWLVRGSLLLLIGLLSARVLQTRSAAMAHRILLVTLFTAAVLPLMVWGLPTWNVIKPNWAASAKTAVATQTNPIEIATTQSQEFDTETALPTDTAIAPIENTLETNVASETTSTKASLATQPTSIVKTEPTVQPARSFLEWVVIIWLVGFAILGTRLLVGIVGLFRLVHQCEPVDAALARTVQESAAKLDVQNRLHVVMSPRGSMPMACWLWRWIIVLPKDIDRWEESLRQAAITHELGHISRRDAWTDLFANLTSCAMWPHPLIWIITRDITRLRERACDEWVLQKSKLDEAGYAESLLTVIQRCQTSSLPIASTMATKKDFESRMRWLVSDSRPQKSKPFATAIAATAIVALSLVVATARPVDPAADPPTENTTEVIHNEEPTRKSPAISVSGTVLDSRTGKPIAGADVILRAKYYGSAFASQHHAKDVLARTTTNKDGKFALSGIGVPIRMVDIRKQLGKGDGGAQVVAVAPGMGMKWVELPTYHNEPQVIKLDVEADVYGTIIDENDQPVAGASLFVRALYAGKDELDSFSNGPGDLNLYSEYRLEYFADEQGGFRIPNLPKDYRAMIWGYGSTGQRSHFVIDTANNDFKEVQFKGGGGSKMPVYRTPLRIKTKQHPWIKVRITDHNGKPVPGGGVQAIDGARHYAGGDVVREDGTAILIVREAGVHSISYGPQLFSSNLSTRLTDIVILPERQETIEIKLPQPRFVPGKVVDSDTSEPIVGVWVTGGRGLACTDADGRFRLPSTSGEIKPSILHHVDGYRAPSLFATHRIDYKPKRLTVKVPEDDSPVDEVTLKISRGLVIKGVVIGSSGKPLAGIPVRAKNQESPYTEINAVSDKDGRFELAGGLSPHVSTRVSALTKLGAAETIILGDQNQPWDETLARAIALRVETGVTLTGRVVHKGKPMAGVTMKLEKSPPGEPGQRQFRYEYLGETKTDKNGRYSISGLKNGERYHFDVVAPGDLQVRDWEHQSPYVQIVKAEDGETVELSDAILVNNGQTLQGIVVDPNGKPIAGISVSAELQSGGNLARPLRGPPPWTKSGEDGKFTIKNLPDEPITLMALGAIIRNSSKVSVEMNAKDIRIIIDPKLGSGIEDLDE